MITIHGAHLPGPGVFYTQITLCGTFQFVAVCIHQQRLDSKKRAGCRSGLSTGCTRKRSNHYPACFGLPPGIYDRTFPVTNYPVIPDTLADMALFPFIRQGAHVDLVWFNAQFPLLSKWLKIFKSSDLFLTIMKKYAVWKMGENGILIQNSYTRNE